MIPGIAGIMPGAGVAAAPSGHTYWRVFCTDNHGDGTGIVISEVEFRATSGGADQASGGTAIGSDDAIGNEFAKAFDDNAATDWYGNSGPTNQWIGYHFGGSVDVTEVLIKMASTNISRMPKNCSLDYSDDGSSWTTSFSFLNAGPLISQDRAYPETPPASGFHRFWRIFSTNVNAGTRVILDEVEFRATSGAADQVPAMTADSQTNGRVIFSSIAGGGNEGWRAFDNTTGQWASATASNEWIGFIFPSPVKVEEVLMKVGSNTTRTPKDFNIEYSDDQVTWTSQKAYTNVTWTASETKVLAAI